VIVEVGPYVVVHKNSCLFSGRCLTVPGGSVLLRNTGKQVAQMGIIIL